MRGANEDNGSFLGYVKGAPRSYFSEEYLSNDPPEEHCGVIADSFLSFRHGGE